jgi:hypothetical protein
VGNVSKKAPDMADARTAPSAGRFEVRVTGDRHFAWLRTRLALETHSNAR